MQQSCSLDLTSLSLLVKGAVLLFQIFQVISAVFRELLSLYLVSLASGLVPNLYKLNQLKIFLFNERSRKSQEDLVKLFHRGTIYKILLELKILKKKKKLKRQKINLMTKLKSSLAITRASISTLGSSFRILSFKFCATLSFVATKAFIEEFILLNNAKKEQFKNSM